jgi:hypothetical protein
MPDSDSINSKDFLKNMSDEQRQRWMRDIVNRMMKAWGVTEQKGLAEILGIHGNTPSNWIQKKAVPWTVIYTCHKMTGVSLDWLYDGEKTRIEVTPVLRKSFESKAVELMTYSEDMGLIRKLKPDGYDFVATGLSNVFINIIQPPEPHKSK